MAVDTLPPVAEPEVPTGLVSAVLVDDHPVVREGVAAGLSTAPWIKIVGTAGSAEECLEIVDSEPPDIVVTDVRLPGMDGIDACRLIRECHPAVRVILLTVFTNESVLSRAFAAGAHGFVVKDSSLERLREAVEIVAGGRSFVDPKLAGSLVGLAARGTRASGPHNLTLQEMRVVEELPRGFTNHEIARMLGISVDTVKTHLRHALAKLGAHDRAHAAALAVRDGLA